VFGLEGFWQLQYNNVHSSLNSSGICMITFDVIFLVTALILQIFIWRYKINLKKKFWKKIFWSLILTTFLFMLFGISDNGNAPWIYVLSGADYIKSGGWWLVLGIFVGILIYLLIVLLSNVLPHKIKHKISKILPKSKQEEQVTNE
jgi:tellurite resistance protein TehA-like permease